MDEHNTPMAKELPDDGSPHIPDGGNFSREVLPEVLVAIGGCFWTGYICRASVVLDKRGGIK